MYLQWCPKVWEHFSYLRRCSPTSGSHCKLIGCFGMWIKLLSGCVFMSICKLTSTWQSFTLFSSLFSRSSVLPILIHNTLTLHYRNFLALCILRNLPSRFSDCFSPFFIPPPPLLSQLSLSALSLLLAPLLPESFPRRGRKPRLAVTSRNSEKNSNWRRTSR